MPLPMVTGQLNSYWSKAFGHTKAGPRFHVTLIRKHALTKTHNFWPNFENDLAKLMRNSWEMGKQTYCLQYECKNVRSDADMRSGVVNHQSENCRWK